MKRKRSYRKPHASYDYEERGFLCLICEEAGFKAHVYDPWEIPRHLKESHKINRKNQDISEWNEQFEKEYLKNRNRPLIYDDNGICVDTTPQEKYEEERKRRLMERKARRMGLS